MLGLLASLNSARLHRTSYKSQARIAAINAEASRTAGRNRRADIELAAGKNLELASANLRTARENEAATLASLKTRQSERNIDIDSGTGNQPIVNAQNALDAQIANMAQSAEITYANMYQRGVDAERAGKLAGMRQDAESVQYRTLARQIGRGMWGTAISGTIGAIIGANSAVDGLGKDASDRDKMLAGIGGAINGADAAGSLYVGFNPFMSALNGDANNRKNNWGWLTSVMMGQTPYRVKASESQFGFYS